MISADEASEDATLCNSRNTASRYLMNIYL